MTGSRSLVWGLRAMGNGGTKSGGDMERGHASPAGLQLKARGAESGSVWCLGRGK